MAAVHIEVKAFEKKDYGVPGVYCGNHPARLKGHPLRLAAEAFFARTKDGKMIVLGPDCAASIAEAQGIDLHTLPDWTAPDLIDVATSATDAPAPVGESAANIARVAAQRDILKQQSRTLKARSYLHMPIHLPELLPAHGQTFLPTGLRGAFNSVANFRALDVDTVLAVEAGEEILTLKRLRTLNKLVKHFDIVAAKGRRVERTTALDRMLGDIASIAADFRAVKNPAELAHFTRKQLGYAEGCARRLGLPHGYFMAPEFTDFLRPGERVAQQLTLRPRA